MTKGKKTKSTGRKGKGGRGQATWNGRQYGDMVPSDPPTGKQQRVYTFETTGTQVPVTAAAGVITAVANINNAAILNFSTRFGAMFDEFRIVSARMRIICTIATTGLSAWWFDENDGNTPTLAMAGTHNTVTIPMNSSNPKSDRVLVWNNHDLAEQGWNPVGNTVNYAWLKGFADVANYGASSGNTSVTFVISPEFVVQCRGIKDTSG